MAKRKKQNPPPVGDVAVEAGDQDADGDVAEQFKEAIFYPCRTSDVAGGAVSINLRGVDDGYDIYPIVRSGLVPRIVDRVCSPAHGPGARPSTRIVLAPIGVMRLVGLVAIARPKV